MNPSSMRAIVLHKPQDLQIEERKIALPGPGEVLVGIERGGICGSDLHYFRHGGFGAVRMKEPMILGHEIAGRIEQLGPGVGGGQLSEHLSRSTRRALVAFAHSAVRVRRFTVRICGSSDRLCARHMFKASSPSTSSA